MPIPKGAIGWEEGEALHLVQIASPGVQLNATEADLRRVGYLSARAPEVLELSSALAAADKNVSAGDCGTELTCLSFAVRVLLRALTDLGPAT